jgi:hypothetical protein
MTDTSVVTSFARLLTTSGEAGPIRRIEIPLIQRDYAQGRVDEKSTRIRDGFLDVLHSAIVGDASVPIELDFVYGDVDTAEGVLRPLDGQQRLTTLFLLHWYVAQRTGVALDGEAWTAFSYATRPSARLFCERLVAHVLPAEAADPAAWIGDQAWFQYAWRHDPTIQAMLTMLHDINDRFADADLEAAWARLTSPEAPAISFHLLPIRDMGAPETLYIKMNSRGKPLTEYENFKARLESSIADIDPQGELAHKIDGPWTDVFWTYRGDDDLVDDEMLRYVTYLIELGEWKRNVWPIGSLEYRARQLFNADNPEAKERLRQFIAAFDTWVDVDVAAYFGDIFTVGRGEGSGGSGLLLFGADARSNLFEACVTTYGMTRGSIRLFSFGQQLLFSAVLAYRIQVSTEVDDVLRMRIRQIRNIIEASENEIRLDRMPALIDEVERLVVHGLSGETKSFNRAQWDDEIAKEQLRTEHPELSSALHSLEDNDLLRGSLLAFELDATSLERQAAAFVSAFGPRANWTPLTAALLAAGDYSRPRDRQSRSFQFGVGNSGAPAPWRTVLTTGTRDSAASLRTALGLLLDRVAETSTADEAFESLRTTALSVSESAGALDWRYYLLKYDGMRDGRSGIYFGMDGAMGYSLCMLEKTQLNSHYRDPYLYAVWQAADVGDRVKEPWFYAGYERSPRWMTLGSSGARLRCVPEGFEVTAPTDEKLLEAFDRFTFDEGFDGSVLRLPQAEVDGKQVDSTDRVVVGAGLVRRLIEAGF